MRVPDIRSRRLIGLVIACLLWQVSMPVRAVNPSCHNIEFFYTQTCPHCQRAGVYLDTLQHRYPTISLQRIEVGDNDDGLQRFIDANERFGIAQPGVPMFVICDQYLIGFDRPDTTGRQIERLLDVTDGAGTVTRGRIELPILGAIDVENYGLPMITLIIGLIDGFNPCAMWVLLFLLSLLVNLNSRARILLVAGTFVLMSGLVYFAFMAAWLNLFLIVGFSRLLQVIVGLTALVIGTIHIKDYFAFKEGVSLSIPETAKPGLYARMRDVIYARNLWASLVTVTVLAILVNMIELLCTAGLPAVYTHILTSHGLSTLTYYAYLVLYNLAYIFDDAVMVAIVVYTLSRTKIQERTGRVLKLISGSVILVLGVCLLLFPEFLI